MKIWTLYLLLRLLLNLNFHLSWNGCSALAGNQQYITDLWTCSRDMTCLDGCTMACNWKMAFCLQHSGTNYIWVQLHTTWCVVMSHLALSTMLLLASYVITMALFNEREKLSKSVGKIEILPSISWFWLVWSHTTPQCQWADWVFKWAFTHPVMLFWGYPLYAPLLLLAPSLLPGVRLWQV